MEEELNKLLHHVSEVQASVNQLRSVLGDMPVAQNMREAFKNFAMHTTNLNGAVSARKYEEVIQILGNIAIFAEHIGRLAGQVGSVEAVKVGDALIEQVQKLRGLAEQSPIGLSPLKNEDMPLVNWPSHVGTQYDPNSIAEQDQRVKKLFSENELRIVGLEQKLKDLEKAAQDEIDKVKEAYTTGSKDVEAKKAQIDDLLALAGKDVVAGEYADSAAKEKNTADWLRLGSLMCMALIAVSLGIAFWETTGTDFDWRKSLFRISLAFLISVPAAYLARESAKHRQQQYQHLQTSLDLKAISPFVASLPEEEQHKIKILIASKIFAGRDFSTVGADSFPINTQEIILEIIKKLDISNKSEKPTA